ncbi:MAG TPA: tetratricopeptide repeat protein [Usitatibacter sp.]
MSAAAGDLQQAYAAFSRGNLEEASRLVGFVLARSANDARARHLAAAIAISSGRLESALAHVEVAIGSDPGNAHQYQTRGQVLRGLGREAEHDFRRAIALDPQFAEAHASLGAVLIDRDPAQSRHHLEFALAKNPAAAEWRYNLSLAEIRAGRDDVALAHLTEVVKQRPRWPDAFAALGGLLARIHRFDDAARALETALQLDPRFSPALNNLGTVRVAQGRIEEARASLLRALEISPRDANAWINLGNVERRRGDSPEAEAAFRRAIELVPNLAVAWTNLGNTLREAARIDEAIASLERAVELSDSSEAHVSLGITLLLADELPRAWAEYRWRHGERPRDDAAAALSRAIEEKTPVVLVGEQGLGDALFFLRWARVLRDRGCTRISFRGDARLFPLLRGTGLFEGFAQAHESTPVEALSIPAGDLPALLAPDASAHPGPLALQALPADVEAARQALLAAGPSPHIAVAWRAGTAPSAGEERLVKHVPVEALGAALRELPGTVVSVQRGAHPGELESLERALGRPVLDASAWNDDIGRIAGMMAAVDAYAGVSSTNVHIAAGLGRPVAVLVPLPPEWRYGASGDRTPWFDGCRIYREDRKQGWDAALAALAAGVRELVA